MKIKSFLKIYLVSAILLACTNNDDVLSGEVPSEMNANSLLYTTTSGENSNKINNENVNGNYRIDTSLMICSGTTIGNTPHGWIDNSCEYGEGILIKSLLPPNRNVVLPNYDNPVFIDGELWWLVKAEDEPINVYVRNSAEWVEEFEAAINSIPIIGVIEEW